MEEGTIVPVVDLSGGWFFRETEEGRRLVRVCQEWGCFRVVNHGVPEGLMREMKKVVGELFEAPPEVKRRNVDVIPGSGYMPPTHLNPLYEAFGLYDVASPHAVDAFCSHLETTPHQREIICTYARHINRVAIDLASKIAQSMGLDAQEEHCFFERWTAQFRINKYSFTERTVGSNGVCIHTDSSFLTVLQEDDCIGGLEVMNAAGEFVTIDPPLPGSLVINLGDIAKVWSNGRFCNLKHRVGCKAIGTRITVALFLLGPKEGAVEPPPALVDPDHPRLYRPFVYEDYRKLRVSSRSRQGEALDLYYKIY